MAALRQKQIDLMVMPVKKGRLDKTLATFRKHYNSEEEGRKLMVEELFNASAPPAAAFHFVFCLDVSRSGRSCFDAFGMTQGPPAV